MNNFNFSNFLVSLLNAQRSGKKKIKIKKNNLIKQVVRFLEKKKIIAKYLESNYFITVYLIYFLNSPSISNIFIISKPSRRIYKNVFFLKKLKKKNEAGFYIISTTKGILSINDSIKKNTGGEVLCYII